MGLKLMSKNSLSANLRLVAPWTSSHMREAADRIDNLESLLKNRPTTDNLISDYVEWSNEVEKVLKNE